MNTGINHGTTLPLKSPHIWFSPCKNTLFQSMLETHCFLIRSFLHMHYLSHEKGLGTKIQISNISLLFCLKMLWFSMNTIQVFGVGFFLLWGFFFGGRRGGWVGVWVALLFFFLNETRSCTCIKSKLYPYLLTNLDFTALSTITQMKESLPLPLLISRW